MSEKPEALRLADDFDRDAKRELFRYLDLDKAAAELRRQHAEIERLREENEEMEVLFKALQEAFARAKEAALRREDV
jgi:hypothetical protein